LRIVGAGWLLAKRLWGICPEVRGRFEFVSVSISNDKKRTALHLNSAIVISRKSAQRGKAQPNAFQKELFRAELQAAEISFVPNSDAHL